jgi:hypothetical protein
MSSEFQTISPEQGINQNCRGLLLFDLHGSAWQVEMDRPDIH